MFKEMTHEEMLMVDGGRTADDGAKLTFLGKYFRAQKRFTGHLNTIGDVFPKIKPVTDEIREVVSFFHGF